MQSLWKARLSRALSLQEKKVGLTLEEPTVNLALVMCIHRLKVWPDFPDAEFARIEPGLTLTETHDDLAFKISFHRLKG